MRLALGLLCAVLLWVWAAWRATQAPLMLDEVVHWPQVQAYLAGQWAHVEAGLTNIPGYHALLGAWMRWVGGTSLAAARVFSGTSLVLAAWAFVSIRRALNDKQPTASALGFVLLPIMLPLAWLVYTDVPSLAWVLMAVALSLRGRHAWASVALLVAIVIRQNNVFWAAWLGLIGVLSLGWPNKQHARDWLAKAWPVMVSYGLPIGVFMVFWWWNGSVSLSNQQAEVAHPDAYFGTGNVFYLLVVCALLFPAWTLHRVWLGMQTLSSKPWRLLWVLGFLGIYALTFRNDHPYNQVSVWGYCVRNDVLVMTAKSAWWFWGFGLVALLGAIGMASARFKRAWLWTVVPFGWLFVSFSWLIETRYTLIPIALWMAFRQRPQDDLGMRLERWRLLYWFALSVYLVDAIYAYRLMF